MKPLFETPSGARFSRLSLANEPMIKSAREQRNDDDDTSVRLVPECLPARHLPRLQRLWLPGSSTPSNCRRREAKGASH